MRRPDVPVTDTMLPSDQFLSFLAAGDEYAISILQVTDIIECGALSKVPGSPAWIRGVHNLRGAVVPVIDLAVKFGLPATVVTRRTCIVIVELRVEDEPVVMGVMADSVNQVIAFGTGDIQAAPAFGPRVQGACLKGMGSAGGRFIYILDIDHVVSSNDVLAAGRATSLADSAALRPPAGIVTPSESRNGI
jgi:purine-binding chemotaxis protein CheW